MKEDLPAGPEPSRRADQLTLTVNLQDHEYIYNGQ